MDLRVSSMISLSNSVVMLRLLVLCRGGGGWPCAAPVQGEPDGNGRLHVHCTCVV